MARSCGLRVGPRRFELVVLDGSPKKHKITAYMTGELPLGEGDEFADAVAVLKEAAKLHKVPRDNIGVAVDTGLAAFRTLKMPFAEKAKIEQVLKFEVENLLPQWNVDDVVVDFHVLETTPEASELLITAVPKADLKRVIGLCEKAGVEPQEVELETTAMVNAALGANVCTEDTAQVLVHFGDVSTSVVVVDGGRVREMRAIHIGALTHELPAPPEDEAEPEPDEPVREGLDVLEPTADPAEIQRRLDQAIRRIRRELGRTLSASRCVHPIQAIHVCGFELPGLVGSKILDIPVLVLDVFEEDTGQPAEGFGALVVPYGVALRQLGGGALRPQLRREELRYTGALERIELPLAVACLLLVTFLGVWNIFLFKEATFLDNKLHYWRDQTVMKLIGAPKQGKQGTLAYPSKEIESYVAKLDTEVDRTRFEQLQRVKQLLAIDVAKLEKDLGQDKDITQPQSALRGLALVLDLLESEGSDSARPSLRKVTSTYQLGRAGKTDSVRVSFDVTFLAADSVAATEYYERFVKDLKASPWFVSFEPKPNDTLENGQGIYIAGMAVNVDVTKAPITEVAQAEPK